MGNPPKPPDRLRANERPIFRHHATTPSRLPPGPSRRFDRRHFGRMASGEGFVMLLLIGCILFWFAIELGICPDVFGWHVGQR